jgi:uncharacterized protein with PIN domain
MSFTGNENHDIALDEATAWTANYRRQAPSSSIKAHFFGKAAIQAILDQDDCVGIRIYYALDTDSRQQLIVVGADENENDLHEGLLAERSMPCPPTCSSGSPLLIG